jgi:hypothetical protein
MTANNYLAVVTSRDARVRIGLDLRGLFFPFNSDDAKSAASAERDAKAAHELFKRASIHSSIAVYAPCELVEDYPAVLSAEEARKRCGRPVGSYIKQYPNGTPYGYRSAGRAA